MWQCVRCKEIMRSLHPSSLRLFTDKAEKAPSFLDDLKRELAEIQAKAQ